MLHWTDIVSANLGSPIYSELSNTPLSNVMVVDSPLAIDSRMHTTQLQCTLGDTGGMETEPRESETVSDRASPESLSFDKYRACSTTRCWYDLRSTFRLGVCVGAM